MFLEFPVINEGRIAVNTDRVTHVKQSYYAKYEKAIICIGEKSLEVDMPFDEVVAKLNNCNVALMSYDKGTEVL